MRSMSLGLAWDEAERGYDDPKAILKAVKKEEKKREKAQMELTF